jgi:hypothetical protein
MPPYDAAQDAYAATFQADVRAVVTATPSALQPGSAVFSSACFKHCTSNLESFSGVRVGEINLKDYLAMWYFGQATRKGVAAAEDAGAGGLGLPPGVPDQHIEDCTTFGCGQCHNRTGAVGPGGVAAARRGVHGGGGGAATDDAFATSAGTSAGASAGATGSSGGSSSVKKKRSSAASVGMGIVGAVAATAGALACASQRRGGAPLPARTPAGVAMTEWEATPLVIKKVTTASAFGRAGACDILLTHTHISPALHFADALLAVRCTPPLCATAEAPVTASGVYERL